MQCVIDCNKPFYFFFEAELHENAKIQSNLLPRKSVAFSGVPVEGCTLANHNGTRRALPRTQRYLACPNMATNREATIPKPAPAPTRLLAQFQPILRKATEYDAFSEICQIIEQYEA